LFNWWKSYLLILVIFWTMSMEIYMKRNTKYITSFLVEEMQTLLIQIIYKWDVLFNNQIIFGDYSKTSFLMWSATSLLQELCLRLVLNKWLLFWWYRRKLTRSSNGWKCSRTGLIGSIPRVREDHNFFQFINSNPNPE